MTVEILKANAFIGIGEGPFYDNETSSLYMVDFTSDTGRILKYDGENLHIASHVGPATFVIPTTKVSENQEFIIGQKQGIFYTTWNSTEPTLISETEKDLPTRFNDGKCDSAGRLWTGTMSLEKSPGIILHKHLGSIYSFSTAKGLEAKQDKITLSNGIAWNKEDDVMYFADSIERKLLSFKFNAETGEISNMETFYDFNDLPVEDYGLPDGCAMDTDNNLWLAMFGCGKVLKINTRNRTIDQEITFPAKLTTSVCFGGPKLDIMYVTSAKINLDEEALKKQPLAGSLFQIRDLGVTGVPVAKFAKL